MEKVGQRCAKIKVFLLSLVRDTKIQNIYLQVAGKEIKRLVDMATDSRWIMMGCQAS